MPIEVIIESLNRPEIEVDSATQQEVVIEPSAGGSGKKDPYIVSNLTTDLEPFTKAGEYHIVMRRYVEQEQYEISLPYILYVQVTPRGTITQILVEPLSHKVRTCIDGVWSEWSEQYIYASKADIEEAKQWAAIGWVL